MKTATVKALMTDGSVVSYSEDVTDSWNEAAAMVDPEYLALGYGMAGAEEELVERCANNSGLAQRVDFAEWCHGSVD